MNKRWHNLPLTAGGDPSRDGIFRHRLITGKDDPMFDNLTRIAEGLAVIGLLIA